jgi:hypothetical protein
MALFGYGLRGKTPVRQWGICGVALVLGFAVMGAVGLVLTALIGTALNRPMLPRAPKVVKETEDGRAL